MNKKYFLVYFWFVSWTDISFGINIDIKAPKIELHVPFGFVTIGWQKRTISMNADQVKWRYKPIIGKRYV